MARMIYKGDSAATHLKMSRRHIRLCGRMQGMESYSKKMQQAADRLAEKYKEKQTATETREDAYDDVIFCDTGLDNMVRTTFEKTRQYDRDHMSRMLDMLFPARGFSDIVRMPLSKEPQEVGQLIVKLESLEEGHSLREVIDPLKEKVDASQKAWEVYQKTIDQLKKIQAEEELAKMAVRQQYEHNWLDARKAYGVSNADSVFPKIAGKQTSVKNEEETEPEDPGDE